MKLNTPNKLTLLRVIMIPLFILALYAGQDKSTYKYIAFLIFALACLTDTLDGYIARSQNLVTNFGKFMDPLADKLLVCSALVCFTEFGTLPSWVTIIIIAREFIISGFRLIASDKGVVIAASYWGKFKTVSQMIMCFLLILNIDKLAVVTFIFEILATALTVISLVDYIIKNKDVLKD